MQRKLLCKRSRDLLAGANRNDKQPPTRLKLAKGLLFLSSPEDSLSIIPTFGEALGRALEIAMNDEEHSTASLRQR
jgi:hypothetical protein